MIRYVYILLAALLTAGPASAGMYKWTDDQGNVHYSQTPPPDRAAKAIAPPPKVSPPPASQAAGSGDGSPEAAASAKAQEEQRQLHERNCQAARKNLELYQNAKAIKEGDQLVLLDNDERKRRLEETQKQIAEYCK